MDFSNKNIMPGELPTIAEATFQPLEKSYLTVERISFFIAVAIFLAVAITLFSVIEAIQAPIIIFITLVVFILLAILLFLAIGISFKYSGYALRERDVLYRSGWLTRKVRVVMLNRIQHVSIQSGPIERKFGLSSVSIFTAGASQADFTIEGITQQTAQNIKAWISTKQDGDLSN